jgi:predicted nucleotidyltransferase
MNISPAKMAEYRHAAYQQQLADEQARQKHYEQTRQTVQQVAIILQTEFKASRVLFFGSVVAVELFHLHSDLDVAAWGIDEKAYHRAHARLLALNANLSVDLVRMEEASDSLRGVIVAQGKTIDELKLLSFSGTNPPNLD